MNVRHHKQDMRGGVTLVELLVVVTILMMLAAFAIPTMRPLTEGRRIREATRAIDVFITQAKIRAAEIQRPVGVLFERMRLDAGDPLDLTDDTYQDDACNILRIVEVPPPYAGEFNNSRVRIQNITTGANYFILKIQINANDFANGLLRVGDQIQFNYQGPFYEIIYDSTPFIDLSTGTPVTANDFEINPATGYIDFIRPADSNYAADKPAPGDTWVETHVLTVATPASELGGVPWPTGSWSSGVPFQVHRQPQASPLPPLRLPKDTVVDLADSGYYNSLDRYPPPPITPPPPTRAFEIYMQSTTAENRQFPDCFGRIGDAGVPQADNRGPMILFAPNGAVRYVYHFRGPGPLPTDPPVYGPFRVTRPVFLMVGKWERTGHETITPGSPVRSLAEDGLHNWQDASNLWMAISPQNGMVTSAEVNAPAATTTGVAVPGDPMETDPYSLAVQMETSRLYAHEAQISKGALGE
jgi:type II secretory pathway pseudopilin PulG